jgi:hypothetical protein
MKVESKLFIDHLFEKERDINSCCEQLKDLSRTFDRLGMSQVSNELKLLAQIIHEDIKFISNEYTHEIQNNIKQSHKAIGETLSAILQREDKI